MGVPPQTAQTDTAESRQYNRIRRWVAIGEASLGAAFLLVLVVTGWSGKMRAAAERLTGPGHYAFALFLYILLLLIISKLLGLGLDFYSFRLEHRYHLSNQRVRGWVLDELKSFAVGLVLAVVVAEVLYVWLMRSFLTYWWVAAWAAFMLFSIVLAQLAPVVLFPIFYKFKPLENEELKARLTRLSERAGTRVRGVYEWKLSEKSKKANAALTGLGATRRIILADTLLTNYSNDEIEAVLAHELGHHVHGHLWKGIMVQVGITFVGFWAADQVLRYSVEQGWFGGISDYSNLPLLALVSTALSLLLLPVLNAFSRFNERQADRYCFGAIADVGPFVSAMIKLVQQNLGERQPSRLVEIFFHSHPPVNKRIAAAEGWMRRSH